MTLRMDQVAAQLPSFIARYREQLEAMEHGLRAARSALDRWDADPAGCNGEIERVMASSQQPYATTYRDEPPGKRFDPPPFEPVTVVAADGSSIEPDRFAAVQCFVVNTGYVVLVYGEGGESVVDARAALGPEIAAGGGDDDGAEETAARGWGVNLRRDVKELEVGANLASARCAEMPVVLLMDGTLFPWDLDSRQVARTTRDELKERTQDALDLLCASGPALSVGAYVSGSRSSDVVTSLRALTDNAPTAWPMADGQIFATHLEEGQRSALFRARSERVQLVENLFSPEHQVCFFYVRIGDDVARVEVPHWATSPAQLERLHATIVDQCRRCDGYPRVLQEAHEQAVISAGDRAQFSRLLEVEAARHGLRTLSNSKQMSKRRRGL